ncbi:MAG: hypothetical protein HZA52_17610 [Planctomycetes bacterium]|nr:hypothetical protein [Planctomycetota bacterium]
MTRASPPADLVPYEFTDRQPPSSERIFSFVESTPLYVMRGADGDGSERARCVGLRFVLKRQQRIALSVMQERDEPRELACAFVRRTHDDWEDETIDLVIAILPDGDGWLGVWRNEQRARALVIERGLGLSEFVWQTSLDWYGGPRGPFDADGWSPARVSRRATGIVVPCAFSWHSSELDVEVRSIAEGAANLTSGSRRRGGIGGVRLPNGWLSFKDPQPPPAKCEWSARRVPMGSVWLEVAVIGGSRE